MDANPRFDQWRDQLPFYVAGTLTASERLAVEDHLRGCADCRAEVHIWRSIAEAVRVETAARAASSDLPVLPIFVNERKPAMVSDRSTLPRRSIHPAWRSPSRTGWLGLSASLLVIVLITGLALGTLAPMFGNRQGGIGASTQTSTTVQSAIPQPLGTLPGDCPPAPLGMTVIANTGVAVGGYPLWVVMGSDRAGLFFIGEGPHTSFGWQAKVIWLAQPDYQGIITVHGANLKTNAPLYFDTSPTDGGIQGTTLTIDTRKFGLVAANALSIIILGNVYVPEAGCYSLQMAWAGGSWQFTFPVGHISSAMETATANAMPTTTAPACTTQIPLSDLLQETETALPTLPTALPGQPSAPLATFAPIPFDQLALGCPSPINLTRTPDPVPACTTPTDGSTPTASPTAAMPGSVIIDCLPPGQHVYIQVCPATIPLSNSNSHSFQGVLGPPFTPCPPTDPPYVSINTRTPTPTASSTPTPGTPTPSAR